MAKKRSDAGKPEPEFMIRVKLPSPSAYPSCPSGDTDYESDYRQAVSAAMPEDFELVTERPGVANPRDSEGYTYLRIRCKDFKKWQRHLVARVNKSEDALRAIQEIALQYFHS